MQASSYPTQVFQHSSGKLTVGHRCFVNGELTVGHRCSEKDLSREMRCFLAAAVVVVMRVECRMSLVRRAMRSSRAALSCSRVSRAWCSSSSRSRKFLTCTPFHFVGAAATDTTQHADTPGQNGCFAWRLLPASC